MKKSKNYSAQLVNLQMDIFLHELSIKRIKNIPIQASNR